MVFLAAPTYAVVFTLLFKVRLAALASQEQNEYKVCVRFSSKGHERTDKREKDDGGGD